MGFITDPEQINQILLKKPIQVIGGVDVLLIGKPGCGKTTALVQIAIINKRKNGEVIVWRASKDCQWTFFLNVRNPPKLILWLKEGLKFSMIDRNKEKQTDPKKYFHKIRYYKTAKELVKNLSKVNINIIQTTPFSATNTKQHIMFCREWLNILESLNERYWKAPISLYFDEIEDLVPEAKGKEFWDVELSLSSMVRSMRKNDISSYFAGHSREEIHWRILKKIRWNIYMRGSKQPKYSRLKINLNKLKIGEAWVEGDQIEKFSFKSLGKEHKLRSLIEVPQ